MTYQRAFEIVKGLLKPFCLDFNNCDAYYMVKRLCSVADKHRSEINKWLEEEDE